MAPVVNAAMTAITIISAAITHCALAFCCPSALTVDRYAARESTTAFGVARTIASSPRVIAGP